MNQPIRHPAVSGAFYPSDPSELRELVRQCFLGPLGPGVIPEPRSEPVKDLIALVCPHAGLIYSGGAAAYSFRDLALAGTPETVILIGPNHRGVGAPIAIIPRGFWRTPLGELPVDEGMSRELMSASPNIIEDWSAHSLEHSLEVELPFLQFLYNSRVKFVPILLGFWDLHPALELGRVIAEVARGRNLVLIASTDFTHYESEVSAKQKDQFALEAIQQLDPQRLWRTATERRITMCGLMSTIAVVEAARILGAQRVHLNRYYTSGEVTGDRQSVVAYASLSFYKEDGTGGSKDSS